MDNEIFIEGTIEDIVYTNPENGYSVIDLSCDKNLITAVGVMPSCSTGPHLRQAIQGFRLRKIYA